MISDTHVSLGRGRVVECIDTLKDCVKIAAIVGVNDLGWPQLLQLGIKLNVFNSIVHVVCQYVVGFCDIYWFDRE